MTLSGPIFDRSARQLGGKLSVVVTHSIFYCLGGINSRKIMERIISGYQ